jgi:hypothetical protein
VILYDNTLIDVTVWRWWGFTFVNGVFYFYIDRFNPIYFYNTANRYVTFAYGTYFSGVMKDLRVFSNGF